MTDTAWAEGYSERKFAKVKLGMSREEVQASWGSLFGPRGALFTGVTLAHQVAPTTTSAVSYSPNPGTSLR